MSVLQEKAGVMTWDFEGDWSKPFPPLKKLNDDG
jgi:hypothetical protein